MPQSGPTSSRPFISIYGYTNYREYLKDFYEYRKESQRGFSYRAFSKAAGFTSPNILKLVIEGTRNIGPQALEKFVVGLHLSGDMADYFRLLVKMNQSKSDEEKENLFTQIKSLTPQSQRRKLEAEGLKYLSHWLYPVLRELVTLPDFREDPYWISRRLGNKATVQQIAGALRFLLKEGFLVRDDENRLAAKEHMILSSDEVKSLAIRNYHRQMIDQAKETLENLPMEDREFGALTMCIPQDALDELKYRMKAFRQELHRWALSSGGDLASDTIVQVNFQMYPHTRRGAS